MEIKITQSLLRLTTRQVSVFLTIASLLLWSYSIMQATFEIGKYGIIGGFPAHYFIALGILTFASAILWPSRENHWRLLLIQLFFLIVSLFMSHLMVGAAQPIYYQAIGDMGWMEYIVRTGSIDPVHLFLLNWPGNYIIHSIVILFTGIDMYQYATFFPWLPILWQFLWFFPLLTFFKNTIGKGHPNYCWTALWIFYLGNWIAQQNTSSSPFGIFCVFSILAILSDTTIWKHNITLVEHRIIVIITFASVTVSHFLSSLVMLAIVVGLFLSQGIKSYKLIVVITLFILAWSMLGAVNYFGSRIPAMIGQVMNIEQAIENGIINPVSGSEARAAVSSIRILFSGLILSAAILGVIITFKAKLNRLHDFPLLIIAAACTVAALIVGTGYNHELFTRFFLYLLPFLAYFGIKLLYYKATFAILAIILVITFPLSFISQYGNEQMDYISPGNLSGYFFFHEHTEHGVVDGYKPIGYIKNQEKYRIEPAFQSLTDESGQIDITHIIRISRYWIGFYERLRHLPFYLCLSNHDKEVETYYENNPGLIEDLKSKFNANENFNLMFMNPDMSLYEQQIYP
jgi:hypothetical protein